MINFFKYVFIIVVIILVAVPFTSLYVQSIDDLAYLLALGIDVGENNNLKVTFQFTMPNSSGEGSTSELAPTVINSVEASSIDTAINLMNTYISKEINLSHCKVIIFSEELAVNGISKELYSLMNKVQIRPDTNIIVSKCTAETYIQSVQPSLENLISKYYEIAQTSGNYTGYTANIKIGDFLNQLSSSTCEPSAILRWA